TLPWSTGRDPLPFHAEDRGRAPRGHRASPDAGRGHRPGAQTTAARHLGPSPLGLPPPRAHPGDRLPRRGVAGHPAALTPPSPTTLTRRRDRWPPPRGCPTRPRASRTWPPPRRCPTRPATSRTGSPLSWRKLAASWIR